jgi:hypoxanthine phosphoribosyltransferase
MALYKPETVRIVDHEFEVLIPESEIYKRLDELAERLNRDYDGKKPVLLGVLNGSFIFLSDLAKRLQLECEIHFVKLSSYGDEMESSGVVKDVIGLEFDVRDRHLIIVEDIVDTGRSLTHMLQSLSGKNPASLQIATFLHKKEATVFPLDIKYVGFEIPNRFVLGYGLDYAQYGRNLAQLYVLKED